MSFYYINVETIGKNISIFFRTDFRTSHMFLHFGMRGWGCMSFCRKCSDTWKKSKIVYIFLVRWNKRSHELINLLEPQAFLSPPTLPTLPTSLPLTPIRDVITKLKSDEIKHPFLFYICFPLSPSRASCQIFLLFLSWLSCHFYSLSPNMVNAGTLSRYIKVVVLLDTIKFSLGAKGLRFWKF